jgi:hypothetical protein
MLQSQWELPSVEEREVSEKERQVPNYLKLVCEYDIIHTHTHTHTHTYTHTHTHTYTHTRTHAHTHTHTLRYLIRRATL